MSESPVHLGSLNAPDGGHLEDFHTTLRALVDARICRRIWDRDATVWREDPTEIDNRLGWLTIDEMRASVGRIRSFAAGLADRGVRDVVLLGMGGSSLAPEVFWRTFGAAAGAPRLHVLDSTSPDWIRRVTASLRPGTFHILVASKSGSTIEVRTLAAHFLEFARESGVTPPGQCVTAITDPGTGLDERATREQFHHTFRNDPDIGGRFSALSFFGMVPAGILGIDVGELLNRAAVTMAAAGPDVDAAENPGARLGAFLADNAARGRDKLGLLLSPSIDSFGLWIEQLLAESTGKDGRGILPVTDEPPVEAEALGPDRCFALLTVDGADNGAVAGRADALAAAGHPVFRMTIPDPLSLGAEMFRWEFATAVAGHCLGVQPFDQPDVQAAKTQTQAILDAFESGDRRPGPETGDLAAALATLKPGGYVAVMVYGDPSEKLLEGIAAWRSNVQRQFRVPTTFGVGPRFLHSTGQFHKGGPAGGVFVQVVLDEAALPIPGERIDFAQLLRAQADGDYAALAARGRVVVRVAAGSLAG